MAQINVRPEMKLFFMRLAIAILLIQATILIVYPFNPRTRIKIHNQTNNSQANKSLNQTNKQTTLIIKDCQINQLDISHSNSSPIVVPPSNNSKVNDAKQSNKHSEEHVHGKEKIAKEHLDKSKEEFEPDPDSGSKHEDGVVDDKAIKKELTNPFLHDPKEQHRVPKEKITFYDDLNADIYSIDYRLSHPMENECRFPILIKDEPDLLPHVQHYIDSKCPQPKNEILVEQLHTGELLIGNQYLAHKNTGFKCYAQELSGALRPKNTQLKFVGDFIELPFNKRIFVEKDQFHVECKDKNNKTIFSDAFTNIPYKERLNPPNLKGTMNFSVSILILDSTSRNQFFRHAPQTLKFMREQDFQILHGQNKVADNSVINLLPLFAGKTFDLKKQGIAKLIRDDMYLSDKMIKDDVWKHAGMLNKLMKDRGCATLMNDDIMVPKLGFLNYKQFAGFYKAPADYYFRYVIIYINKVDF